MKVALAYSECFRSLSANGRSEIDDLVSKYSREEEVRDTYEELVSREEEWNRFIQAIGTKYSDEFARSMTDDAAATKRLTDSQLSWNFVDFQTKKYIAFKDNIRSNQYTLFAFFRQTG